MGPITALSHHAGLQDVAPSRVMTLSSVTTAGRTHLEELSQSPWDGLRGRVSITLMIGLSVAKAVLDVRVTHT